MEPAGLYDVINVLLASRRRQESLGSEPSFVTYPSAYVILGSTASPSLNFLILKVETKMVPSLWRWYGDWVK